MTTLETTPVIHASAILRSKSIGDLETSNGDFFHVVSIKTAEGRYLVAGGVANAGLLPEFARAFDPDFESLDECLQEFAADLESPEHASGELLAWHGSLCI